MLGLKTVVNNSFRLSLKKCSMTPLAVEIEVGEDIEKNSEIWEKLTVDLNAFKITNAEKMRAYLLVGHPVYR